MNSFKDGKYCKSRGSLPANGGRDLRPRTDVPFFPADARSRFRMNAVGCNMARRSGRPQLEIKVNLFPFRQPLRKTGEGEAGNG